jgi:hypothetical protein
MPTENESKVVEIPEPFGWQSLYSIMESNELEADEEGDNDDENGEGDEIEDSGEEEE